MSHPRPLIACLLLLPLLVGGCRSTDTRPVFPNPDRDAAFSFTTGPASGMTDVPWWETELDTAWRPWVEHLLSGNPAIRIAMTETHRQQARLLAAEAAQGPSLDASAGGSVTRDDDGRSSRIDAGVDALLPVDLSGELASLREARAQEHRQALLQLQQVRLEQVRTLLLALIDHAEARQRERLLEEQVATTRQQLHLTEIRFGQGLVSSVDVLQQREQIALLQQQFPDVRLDQRLAMNRTSELLGNTPVPDPELPGTLPDIPPGLTLERPAQLLRRRPELLAQQAALAAADAEFEAALRARLPDLSFSGNALWQLVSGNPGQLVKAALDASLNLFDSGARAARIGQRRALLEQAGLRYLQDWLSAVRETDDLLHTVDALDRQLSRNREARHTAEQLYRATLSRYQRGIGDYLPVLTALRDLQQQQREALRLRAERQRNLVRLKSAAGLPGATLLFGDGADS